MEHVKNLEVNSHRKVEGLRSEALNQRGFKTDGLNNPSNKFLTHYLQLCKILKTTDFNSLSNCWFHI